MPVFRITVDAADVAGLAEHLGRTDDPQVLGRAALRAVNSVAGTAYTDARTKMNSRINLPDSYLQERMQVVEATDPLRPMAKVVARARATTLTQYGARQIVAPVRWPNSRIADKIATLGANPRKPGALLAWKERTGDPSRGIEPDMKAAGVAVEVTRNSPKPIGYAFFITGRNSNRLVVERVGKGKKVRALYGPSVHQLFRGALSPEFLEQVSSRLSRTTLVIAVEELRKALE